jgi:hypothetical protein
MPRASASAESVDYSDVRGRPTIHVLQTRVLLSGLLERNQHFSTSRFRQPHYLSFKWMVSTYGIRKLDRTIDDDGKTPVVYPGIMRCDRCKPAP